MQQVPTTNPLYFLPADSEMAALIRRKDWSQTPVGPPESWPPSLRTLVHMMLSSRFPMLIFWGPELITLYNDAFRPGLGNNGKHPVLLGQRGEESQAESWPVTGPMIRGIMAGGEAVLFEDRKLPIYRDGQMDYAYWTYSFSPLTDDAGMVNGVLVTGSETTKAVESQQQSADSAAQFERLVQQAPVAMSMSKGPDHVIEIANERVLAIWGRRPEAVLGRPTFTVFPEAKGQDFEAILDGVYTTGEPFRATELPATLSRNGTLETIYLNLVYEAFRDMQGRVAGVMQVAVDVTEQVMARQKLQASETRLRSIIDNAPAAMSLLVGRDLVMELPNQVFIDILDRGPDITGRPLREIMPELTTENQPFLQLLDDVYTSGKPFQTFGSQVKILREGVMTDYYYNITYTPLRDAAGEVFAILDIAIDVTEQIRAQQQLAEQKTYLQNAIAIADLGTYALDMTSNTVTFSEPIRQWFGLSSTHESTEVVLTRVHPDDLPQVQAVIGSALLSEENSNHDIVYRVINSAGDETHVRSFGKARYVDGVAHSLTGVLQNVTAQVQAQETLRRSEMRLQKAISTKTAGVLFFSLNGQIRDANETFTRMSGYSRDELTGPVHWKTLTDPEFWDITAQSAHNLAVRGETPPYEKRMLRPDGSHWWGLFAPTRLSGEGTESECFEFIIDTTARREAQATLRESESQYRQLAAELEERVKQRTRDLERSNLDLMQFASVASHDLKEPSRKVQTFATRLQELLADRMSDEEVDLFRRLVNSAARMQTLVSDVLRLSKLSDTTATFGPVDLNAVLNLIRDDLELTIREQGAEFRAGTLPTVQAEPAQMHQLFLNLASNALKFQNGRTPRIRVEAVPITESIMTELGLPDPHQYAVIAVSDNGIGFDPKYKDKIFGMFQRLHGRSQFAGTGIGLTIVKKIVDNHRGYIDVQSQPDAGTTFRVALPLTPRSEL